MSFSPTRTRQSLLLSDQQGFDRRWFAHSLKAIYAPTNDGEVVEAVESALHSYGRNVKITSGRHCYENFVYNDNTGAIIDMSGITRIGLDPDRGYFVDAGCENWTVYRTLLNSFGKTLPAGSCYSVGAGGHITGGGYGLLSRLHGLTVDHLTGVDIVTVDVSGHATARHVSSESESQAERDLFWAVCGGGGGNFGVIIRYYFKTLPDAPNYATIQSLAWNWDTMTATKFADLLAAYADMMPTLDPRCFTLLKLTHKSSGQLGLLMQIASDPNATLEAHRQFAQAQFNLVRSRLNNAAPSVPLTQPLGGHPCWMTALPPADSESDQTLTYLEAVQTLNGSGPNQFGKYKSAYMKKAFPANQVAAIYNWLTVSSTADLSSSLLQVDSYGAAINTRASDATPVPQRDSIMKLQFQTYWNNASRPGEAKDTDPQAQAHLNWINGFYEDVYSAYGGTPNPACDPDGVVDGCYYNYPDVDLGTHDDGRLVQALRLYFKDNLERLVSVKRHWDEVNYFNHAQSIPPWL